VGEEEERGREREEAAGVAEALLPPMELVSVQTQIAEHKTLVLCENSCTLCQC
jgi:hypothetical protein